MLPAPTPAPAHPRFQIALHRGARRDLWPLFELADASPLAIRRYLDLGLVHVVALGGVPVGHAQIVPGEGRPWELRSLAVLAPYRGRGLGSKLVRRSMAWAREHAIPRLVLGTVSSDLDAVRFFQRLDFRIVGVERDAYALAHASLEGLPARALPARDRIWMQAEL